MPMKIELNSPSIGKFLRFPVVLFFLISFCLSPLLYAEENEKAASREQSQFNIYVAGKEVGKEKFMILTSSKSVKSSSILEFQEPGKSGRTMKIETQMTTDSQFLPQSYQVKIDLDGKKEVLIGTFDQGQAMFETKGSGAPRKSGVLMGERCTILDSNVFHHFIFIARAFNLDSKEKYQSFDVIVPQEPDNGILKVGDLGIEKTSLRGKEKNLHHLLANSGQLIIDLWIDNQNILHKIAIPVKKVEIIRAD
jgi:hypothetical protein